MRVLLDTHSFLWFIAGSPMLSQSAKTCIEDAANEKLISIASIWEMAIKISIGRLSLSEPFERFIPHQIQMNGFDLLPILFDHLAPLTSLPFHHRDPFDRLLVSQCITEKCAIISRDAAFDSYQIERLW
ncbi:MAG: type II toxin-antitoxin system VapC family toxin [Desulfobacteraceae bacterium]|nr:MAG: type II toxin-antitoxin system VapC family toxin [Desulfobacteraceae bacterium]